MSYQLILWLTTLLVAAFSFLLLIRKLKQSTKELPPGPRKLPIIGNLHQLGRLPHVSFQLLSKKYGPLMYLRLGSVHTLVVSSADLARDIFKTHDLAFSGRPVLYAANKLGYNGSSITFSPYSDYWREMRKVLVLELFSSKKVQILEAIRDAEVALMMKTIADSSSNSNSNDPVNLSKLAFTLSNNVICRVAFGKTYDEKSEFHQIFNEAQDLIGRLNIADFLPWMAWINYFNGEKSRLDKNFRELDTFFDKVIAEHLHPDRTTSEHEKDIVDALLQIEQDLKPSGANIKGVLADVLVAGSDTSAATVEWTMAELIRNPSVMRKAQQEIRQVCRGKEKVEETDVAKLKYLKLVIKESLRMHPPVPLLAPRITPEDCVVGGYNIPAKTRVFFNAASISNDPAIWENPDEFKPERFMDSAVDFRGQNFELLPFGAGRRSCPGMNFGLALVELALANLLLLFDWAIPEGMVAEELDMKEAAGLTVHKETPLRLIPCIGFRRV